MESGITTHAKISQVGKATKLETIHNSQFSSQKGIIPTIFNAWSGKDMLCLVEKFCKLQVLFVQFFVSFFACSLATCSSETTTKSTPHPIQKQSRQHPRCK